MTRINKEIAGKMLTEVPDGKQFYCTDGRVAKNLPELELALKGMSEETFYYHSNETKSDFSNWVRDVIGDEKLSRDLQKSTSRTQAVNKVADRMAWLHSKTMANI